MAFHAEGDHLQAGSPSFGPLGQPHLLNRMMALKDESALRAGQAIALAWFVVVLGGMFLTGLSGHVLVSRIDDSERLFFVLAEMLLPAVIGGVLIAAVLSAVMSTADSQLLVAASVVSHDLGLAHERVWISRIVIAIVVVLAVALAIGLPEAIFSRVLFAWNALGATFGPIVVLTILQRRYAPTAAPFAMASGFLLTVLFYALPDSPGDVMERLIPFVVGTAVLLVWPLRAPSAAAGTPLTLYGESRVDAPNDSPNDR